MALAGTLTAVWPLFLTLAGNRAINYTDANSDGFFSRGTLEGKQCGRLKIIEALAFPGPFKILLVCREGSSVLATFILMSYRAMLYEKVKPTLLFQTTEVIWLEKPQIIFCLGKCWFWNVPVYVLARCCSIRWSCWGNPVLSKSISSTVRVSCASQCWGEKVGSVVRSRSL